MNLNVIVIPPEQPGKWETTELVAVFERMVKNLLFEAHDYDLTPEGRAHLWNRAQRYGTSLGHYGRLALAERGSAADIIEAIEERVERMRHTQVHPIFRDVLNQLGGAK